ncbi:MAG: F0F1 ATP synthase subunit B [Candidatus Colwellbacteria bacterium]|nr:F0F1 ATP synthase subunit B [Candidatus Colwellbacteria bacterium]
MGVLLTQLGVNWKLLFTQGVNFLILLVVLTAFVYKPLLKLLDERRRKIETGLKGAEEAEARLKDIERLKRETLSGADKSALEIISIAEKNARKRSGEIISGAEKKAEDVLKSAAVVAEHKKMEELEKLNKEARFLIKEVIVKTVELDPRQIDENLITSAFAAAKEKIL